MEKPTLKINTAESETFAGYTYSVDGELVPVLVVDLQPGQTIFFEHHILLWKSTGLEIKAHIMKKAMKRLLAGLPIIVTQATGPGQISFSRDGPGHVFGLHMKAGEEIDVREHQFLAATENINYTFRRVKGFSNILFGGTGFFIDKFIAECKDGILWMHGYGNVFEKFLQPGEQIDVEPGGWLYKDASVAMESKMQSISTGFLSGTRLIMNRFTGPGRVAIQSMYYHMPTSD